MEKVTVRWSYQPTDYFPTDVTLSTSRADFHIAAGVISALLKPPFDALSDQYIASIRASVEDVFVARQLETVADYNLEGYSIQTETEDGKKHITAVLLTGVLTLTGGATGVVVTDATGSVLRDPSKEAVDRALTVAATVAARHKDTLAQWILDQLREAARDRGNELSHYYDIVEALEKKFGGEKPARQQLGVPKKTWDRLGKLANGAPLVEGRHRGRFVGTLRKATSEELKEARVAAREIVFKYLQSIK